MKIKSSFPKNGTYKGFFTRRLNLLSLKVMTLKADLSALYCKRIMTRLFDSQEHSMVEVVPDRSRFQTSKPTLNALSSSTVCVYKGSPP